MIIILLQAFYLALPAYLANMAPVIIDKLRLFQFLNKPIDANRLWRDEPILGRGKTWRGLICGALTAVAVAGIQALLYNENLFREITIVDFSGYNFLLFGFLAGSGALLGDLIKSFFKRRLGILSGASWPIADQLDFIAGFLLFTGWLVRPEWPVVVALIILTLILHPLTNLIGYLIRFKKVWW
ncbi:MAG: CDP-2,3-bis-(O-geranylgeranyl)-sn-glycerol synthase [Patescibacteria group bacterium]|nr:CDP-2,3-bis-(O-geranylgeranyl)-sn-glycerol synthase [Patescibacteria group bacterium]